MEETKSNSLSMKLKPLMSFIALLTLLGCTKQLKWEEEVKLQSGEVLLLTRTAQAKPFGEVGGPGGWANDGMTIKVKSPSKDNNPPPWAGKLVPVLFDRDPATNEWLIVATVTTCTDWYDLGRPSLPYAEFRTRNGAWKKQELSRDLIGRETNLLTSIHSSGETNQTIAEKDHAKTDPTISPEFKRIINKWKSNC
jgi:hypothetical protein